MLGNREGQRGQLAPTLGPCGRCPQTVNPNIEVATFFVSFFIDLRLFTITYVLATNDTGLCVREKGCQKAVSEYTYASLYKINVKSMTDVDRQLILNVNNKSGFNQFHIESMICVTRGLKETVHLR